ncbi:MAG: hypothetical protein IKM99_05260 [Bacteroidales bacterium]|nr:hypothetical protein [Bacteroidales bacterium]
MTLEEFELSCFYQRIFVHKLDTYEDFVYDGFDRYLYLSASLINDWKKE